MTDQSVEWYLARNGKQFGPVADDQLRKLVESGQLMADDLLWRQGFAEWQPAAMIFGQPGPTVGSAQPATGSPSTSANGVHAAGSSSPAAQTSATAAATSQGSAGRYQDDQRTQIPYERPHSSPGEHGGGGYATVLGTSATTPAPARGGLTPATVVPRPDAGIATPTTTSIRHVQTGSGRGSTRLLVALALLMVAGGIVLGMGWLGRASFVKTASSVNPETPPGDSAGRDAGSTSPPAPDRPQPVPQIKAGAEEAADKNLQASLLWQVLKREFPDWYVARVQETAQLKANRKDAAEITRQQMAALVKLRRQHLNDALSATLPRLSAVATAFHDSLVLLSKHSSAACFEFVSQGELAPTVIALMDQPAHRQHIDTLMASIFMAVADGRKSPRVYPPPKQADYQLLTAELTKRGWSEADLQLFSNAQELSKTKPDKVCSMVRDWFAAQLAVADVQAQLRLLAEALKPLISG